MSTNGVLTMTERASAPDTPTTSDWRFYFKSDGLYYVDDAGTETGPVSTGTGATTALDNLASVQLNTDIIPDTDITHDIGSSSARMAEVWANNLIGDLEIQVYNNTGSPIAIEQVVYISGFNVGASLPEVSLADADAGSGAEVAIGITKVAISNGSSGRIVISGQATYPTTGLSEGDRLYLDTTAGSLTDTRPTSGNILEFGEVLRVGASGTGLILVNPQGLLDLDVAETLSNKTLTDLTLTDATELTISTGSVTKTQSYHTIDTESDAASDDLDTISGGTAGDILYIVAANDARTVVVKNGTGNILTYGGSDISLDEDHKVLELVYDGTNWREVGNAAGGGSGATVVSANKTHEFGSGQSTTSATMVDVDATNAAITITATGGGKAHVMFSFLGSKSTAGNAQYRLTDGTNNSETVELPQAAGERRMVLHWIFDTSAGSTTYKLQFSTDDANAANVRAFSHVMMTVMEVT